MAGEPGASLAGDALEQIGGVDMQPAHLLHDAGPFLLQKLGAGVAPQAIGGTIGNEHADTAFDDDQTVILKTLIGLGGGQWIGAMFRGKSTDRGEGVAIPIDAIQYRFGDDIAKTKIDGAILAAHCVTLC
jgi:hypothetical protein